MTIWKVIKHEHDVNANFAPLLSMDTLINLSVPQFPHLKNGHYNTTHFRVFMLNIFHLSLQIHYFSLRYSWPWESGLYGLYQSMSLLSSFIWTWWMGILGDQIKEKIRGRWEKRVWLFLSFFFFLIPSFLLIGLLQSRTSCCEDSPLPRTSFFWAFPNMPSLYNKPLEVPTFTLTSYYWRHKYQEWDYAFRVTQNGDLILHHEQPDPREHSLDHAKEFEDGSTS